MTKSSAPAQSKPKQIASLREAIAEVEQEECHCIWHCKGSERLLFATCARCQHLEDLDAQLQEAEAEASL